MAKVIENAFRAVNIAFANELARICRNDDNRDAYTEAKTDFIRHFTAEARKKYGNRY